MERNRPYRQCLPHSPPGAFTPAPFGSWAQGGLVPVFEGVRREGNEDSEDGGADADPEQPPGRAVVAEDQGESADQEASHDDRHGDPGDRAAVEGRMWA